MTRPRCVRWSGGDSSESKATNRTRQGVRTAMPYERPCRPSKLSPLIIATSTANMLQRWKKFVRAFPVAKFIFKILFFFSEEKVRKKSILHFECGNFSDECEMQNAKCKMAVRQNTYQYEWASNCGVDLIPASPTDWLPCPVWGLRWARRFRNRVTEVFPCSMLWLAQQRAPPLC